MAQNVQFILASSNIPKNRLVLYRSRVSLCYFSTTSCMKSHRLEVKVETNMSYLNH